MIIAKAMDRDNGRNIAFGTPFITKEGANTARIHSRISNNGKAISMQASSIARRLGLFISRCWWMFSIVTVAWSTRMPMASARPLNVMMLIVCPRMLRMITETKIERGIETATIIVLRQLPKKTSIINDVRHAAIMPSLITPDIDAFTKID